MKPLRISIVSYINSFPFVYGLQHFAPAQGFDLKLCPPAGCARQLLSGDADCALVPVGALPALPEKCRIITPFCIGAVNSVGSVLLLSMQAKEELNTVYLDTHSMTSAKLVQVLAKHYWKINPAFRQAAVAPDFVTMPGEGVLAIGDKCFDMASRFSHVTDLADAWRDFSGLPFVFAVWVAQPHVSTEQENALTAALNQGVNNREKALEMLLPQSRRQDMPYFINYLNNNISFHLDDPKNEAIPYFLKLINSLEKND